MRRSIFLSVFLVAAVVFLATLGVVFSLAFEYFSEGCLRELRTETGYVAAAVTSEGERFFASIDALSLARKLPSPGEGEWPFSGANPALSRITWIAPDGAVRYDSAGDVAKMENHLGREEVREALDKGEGIATRDSSVLTERLLYCARKLPDGSVVRLSTSHFTAARLLLMLGWPIAVIAVAAFLTSLVLAWYLASRITEPLNSVNLDKPDFDSVYEDLHPLLHRIVNQRLLLEEQHDELKFSRREREAAETSRREFTANVSHELKTPLQTIGGSAELLAGGIVEIEDVPKFGARILAESKRMAQLIDDIIKLSKLDEGAPGVETEPVDLRRITEAALAELSEAAARAEVSLTLAAGGEAKMSGVAQYLSAIVFNLIDNAIKYNRRGGSVAVAVESFAAGVKLTVRDNGIGIAKDEQRRVFERFYRVDKSRSKDVGGTGLGLSIVKHAAILHRAEIALESELGKGSTFTVTFPKS